MSTLYKLKSTISPELCAYHFRRLLQMNTGNVPDELRLRMFQGVKIVKDMGDGQQTYMELFEKEFRERTTIGNNFRIRHHEITKIDI